MSAIPILVTGGSGYIGSHTCKKLKKEGFLPVIVDITSPPKALSFCPYFPINLLNPDALEEVFTRYEPKAVLHFAAFTSVGDSVKSPEKFYENNVTGSINLLKSCIEHKVFHFIFSSSAAVYGMPKEKIVQEDDPLIPISPYGRTKKIIEELLQDLDTAHGLKSVSLRYFNAAGADPEGELGEDREEETHLIPLAIETGLKIREKLLLFGEDYPTKDGSAIRDYVHVADLAEGHVLALQYLLQKKNSCQLNLGTGKGYSVKEVLQEIEKKLQTKLNLEICPRRKGDPSHLVASIEKAKKTLGFSPKNSSLASIVETAIFWAKQKVLL